MVKGKESKEKRKTGSKKKPERKKVTKSEWKILALQDELEEGRQFEALDQIFCGIVNSHHNVNGAD